MRPWPKGASEEVLAAVTYLQHENRGAAMEPFPAGGAGSSAVCTPEHRLAGIEPGEKGLGYPWALPSEARTLGTVHHPQRSLRGGVGRENTGAEERLP